MQNHRKDFKTFLQEALEEKELKACDLCRLTGIPKVTMSYYLSGKTVPRLDKLKQICFALDIPYEPSIARDFGVSSEGCTSRLWRIWHGMKQRCYWEGHSAYKYYGAQGVTVCDEWLHSFVTFEDWALSNGYQEHLTIDRINPYGNYEPNNCRWATYKEQANNKRRHHDQDHPVRKLHRAHPSA